MTSSFPSLMLSAGIILLLAFILQKIISGIHTKNVIKWKSIFLIMIPLLAVWIVACIIIFFSAGLSHSAKIIDIYPAQCILLLLILAGLPGISLLLFNYRNFIKGSGSVKIKAVSVFIFSILISFIFYFSAESGMWPPLAVSCRYDFAYTSRLLIKMGANVNEKDVYGFTPILYSAGNGDIATTELLLENGADLKTWGIPSLREASLNGQPELAEFLISKGIDVNSIVYDYPGWTVLMAAAAAGQLDVVKMLIRKGALTDIYDKTGKTALMIAEEKSQIRIAEFLKLRKPANK